MDGEIEIYFDFEEKMWGVGDHSPIFSMSEALMVREIAVVFGDCSWEFTEAIMRLCGWDEDKKIANFVPRQILIELHQDVLENIVKHLNE